MKIITTLIQQRIPRGWLTGIVVSALMLGMALASTVKESESNHQKDDQDEREEKIVMLTATELKTAAIELATAGPALLHESLSVYGTVQANGEKIQQVSARFAGNVRSIHKTLSDNVHEGEMLATIEGNDSMKTYSLTSALNGIVVERNINVGEQTGDKILFVIADLSSVWVSLDIFPRDANKIHLGQAARITNPNTNATAEGEIIAISAMGTSETQEQSARVLLNNNDRQWVPGLFVNADVILDTAQVAVAIHNNAIQSYEGNTVVFVKGKKGFEPRLIELGRSDEKFSEVLSGLAAGELYASKNSFIIKADLGKDGVEDDD